MANRIARPTTTKEYVKLLKDRGFTVTVTKASHYKAEHPRYPSLPPVRFAFSPSDGRSILNNISWVKRTYGIDLRYPPQKGK